MKIGFFSLGFACSLALARPSNAAPAPVSGPVLAPVSAPVSAVRAAQIGQLRGWGATGVVLAQKSAPLDLDVRAADLDEARATKPLQSWVRGGGIVVLHTDAAQIFGFGCVQARERTRERAGQLWGRSAGALAFGGSPLLLGGRSSGRVGQTDGVPGVRTVFYRLDSGDALLSDVGAAGVPLLRVEDNSAPAEKTPDPTTLYAAALRRYGRGWAIFLPRTLEARADGARFQANLREFLAAAAGKKWVSLPVAALDSAFVAARAKQKPKWEDLLETLRLAENEVNSPQIRDETGREISQEIGDEAQLLLSSQEAKAVAAVWEQADEAPRDGALQERGRALIYLLLARARWQEDADLGAPFAPTKLAALWGDDAGARQTLWRTQAGGPAASMTLWWCGVLALGAALPPVPRQYQPEIIEFSYARPALEAARWWRELENSEQTPTPMVSLAGGAALEMAQQHEDDPELLSCWQTPNGSRYSMQLTAAQAVSTRFPARPQQWGMPRKSLETLDGHKALVLVPLGSGLEMLPGPIREPIFYSSTNAIWPQMFWRSSVIVSSDIAAAWGYQPQPVHIFLKPYLTGFVIRGEGRSLGATGQLAFSGPDIGDVRGQKIQLTYPFVWNDGIYLRCSVHPPVANWPAYLDYYKTYGVFSNDILRGVESAIDACSDSYEMGWMNYEANATLTPARFSRLQAHLLTTFWMEERAPLWMEEGLQNVFSLDMALAIESADKKLSGIAAYPPPEYPKVLVFNPRARWAKVMASAARRQSLAAIDAETEPFAEDASPSVEADDYVGTPLEELDSTRRVQFFYDRFGAGAFVETLQRLGSGQSADQALQATTGLTQQQFFAAADAADAQNR